MIEILHDKYSKAEKHLQDDNVIIQRGHAKIYSSQIHSNQQLKNFVHSRTQLSKLGYY